MVDPFVDVLNGTRQEKRIFCFRPSTDVFQQGQKNPAVQSVHGVDNKVSHHIHLDLPEEVSELLNMLLSLCATSHG